MRHNASSIFVMRVTLLLSVCFLGAFAHTNGNTSVSIDAVVPSEEFSYGCHELRWTADMDGDGLIGPDEVELKRAGTWSALTADEYQNIVVRRRSQLYMENAFIYKKTPTRDLELYVDYPEGWQPAIPPKGKVVSERVVSRVGRLFF